MFTLLSVPLLLTESLSEKGGFFKVLSWILDVIYGALFLFFFEWLLGLFLPDTAARIISFVLLGITVVKSVLVTSARRRREEEDK